MDLLDSIDVENLAQHLFKVAKSQPREGMNFELDEAAVGCNTMIVEGYCLHKPEYLYKLGFIDLLTGLGIHLDEYSVCKICFEPNPTNEQLHMAVCAEFTEKRNRTTASHITVMPKLPLLPHILTMIFNRETKFVQQNDRYGGIMIGPTFLKFKYSFSGKDVEEINEIRTEISQALFDEKGILNPRPLHVREKMIKLLTKRRLPHIDDQ